MSGTFRCCLLFLGALLCSCASKNEPSYQVELPSGHGLMEQADVRMKGVKVGRLERMAGDMAVFVPLNKEMGFDAAATWKISATGLLGDRFLDVTPGPEGARKLKFGETIKVSAMDRGMDQLIGEKMAKSLQESLLILEALSKVPDAKREEATKAALDAIGKVHAEAGEQEGK